MTTKNKHRIIRLRPGHVLKEGDRYSAKDNRKSNKRGSWSTWTGANADEPFKDGGWLGLVERGTYVIGYRLCEADVEFLTFARKIA